MTGHEDGTELFAICVYLESGEIVHDIRSAPEISSWRICKIHLPVCATHGLAQTASGSHPIARR